MKYPNTISQEKIKSLFVYEAGALIWDVNPKHHTEKEARLVYLAAKAKYHIVKGGRQ